MDEVKILPNTVLIGEREYAMALDYVIATANQELCIFDQDFTKGDYASINRYRLIQAFLQKNIASKLTIILHSSHYLSANCPRLMGLLRFYGHKITVYETNDFAKIAKDCFVIADKQYYCRRFHIDQARFKYSANGEDAETALSLLLRFNELLAETQGVLAFNKLGL